MPHRRVCFSNDDLRLLRRVHIGACMKLGIDWTDRNALRRERVAAEVMDSAREGRDPWTIRRAAVARERRRRAGPR